MSGGGEGEKGVRKSNDRRHHFGGLAMIFRVVSLVMFGYGHLAIERTKERTEIWEQL
jgi:hypothetical protein